MLIVSENDEEVVKDVKVGNLTCNICFSLLILWGYGRWRTIRTSSGEKRIRPRRARCKGCNVTHTLLPIGHFLRRRDDAQRIMSALLKKADGISIENIADLLNIPFTTVRGWMRRFKSKATEITNFFNDLAINLNASLNEFHVQSTPFSQALESIGTAVIASQIKFGIREDYEVVTLLSKGMLLSPSLQAA